MILSIKPGILSLTLAGEEYSARHKCQKQHDIVCFSLFVEEFYPTRNQHKRDDMVIEKQLASNPSVSKYKTTLCSFR